MNEELMIRKLQEERYGPVHQPTDEQTIRIKVLGFRQMLTEDLTKFKDNPSAENFSSLKMSMYWYQYWMQKATYDEVEE